MKKLILICVVLSVVGCASSGGKVSLEKDGIIVSVEKVDDEEADKTE